MIVLHARQRCFRKPDEIRMKFGEGILMLAGERGVLCGNVVGHAELFGHLRQRLVNLFERQNIKSDHPNRSISFVVTRFNPSLSARLLSSR